MREFCGARQSVEGQRFGETGNCSEAFLVWLEDEGLLCSAVNPHDWGRYWRSLLPAGGGLALAGAANSKLAGSFRQPT